jgi:hypothetical protein
MTTNPSAFGGTAIISTVFTKQSAPQPLTFVLAFDEQVTPWGASVSGLAPITTGGVTVTFGTASGNYDDGSGEMNLTLPITISAPYNCTATFDLSTSKGANGLSLATCGMTGSGAPFTPEGTLVGIATLSGPGCSLAGIVVGLEITGRLAPPVQVPFIVGMPYDKGLAVLEKVGLVPIITDVSESSGWPDNKFLSVDPPAGSTVAAGSMIQASVAVGAGPGDSHVDGGSGQTSVNKAQPK